MMQKTMISYNIGLFYAFTAFMAACVMPDWKTNLWTTAALGGVCLAHYAIVYYNESLIPYAEAFQPIAVIDWGPFGKDFKLPDHLAGQYVLCSASEVAAMVEEVRAKLEAAENPLFVSPLPGCPQLEVYPIYYAKGEYCNEGDKYRGRVISTMEAKRLPWHIMMDTGEWEGKPLDIEVDASWYRENYLETCANGSVKA